jgi:hypothetical protein
MAAGLLSTIAFQSWRASSYSCLPGSSSGPRSFSARLMNGESGWDIVPSPDQALRAPVEKQPWIA